MANSTIKKPRCIAIDSIIGGGKTTFIHQCLVPTLKAKGYNVAVIDEPVEKWKQTGILADFYSDPKRHSFRFQVRAFHDRIEEAIEIHDKSRNVDIYIMERSIFTDRVFAKMLNDSDLMTESEYKDYQRIWKMWNRLMPLVPDMFVYLKPTVETAMKRIKERGRNEETSVSIEYQENLAKEHDRVFGGDSVELAAGQFVPCIHLDSNVNFRDCNETKQSLSQVIEDCVLRLC